MPLEIAAIARNQSTTCQHATVTLHWRAERHYIPGTIIELRAPKLRSFHLWTLVRADVDGGDVSYRWPLQHTVSDIWTNPKQVYLRAKLLAGVRRGETVAIHLTLIPPQEAGLELHLQIWTAHTPLGKDADPNALVYADGAQASLVVPVEAGRAERLGVYCRPTPGPDGTVRALIVPQDIHGNATRYAAPVPCRLTWNGETTTHSLQSALDLALPTPTSDVARLQVALPMAALAIDENAANGRRDGADLIVTGNPVWAVAPDGLAAAFGEIHWHTDHSGDGQGPMAEAFRTARDELNLQFAAPSDHSPAGERWTATVASVQAANAPDHFATLFGWENSTQRGHENYYFTDPDHPMACGGSAGFGGGTLERATALLDAHDQVLAIPHHANSVAKARRESDGVPFWFVYDWDRPQRHRRLVEIFQTRGNQERNNYPDQWRGWHNGNGASVQDALRDGHRVGFTAGTDNHCARPGRAWSAYEGGPRHPTHSQMLTGLWTARVERQAVFDALYARHTWAVWDCRALVHFTVNDALAGDEIRVPAGTPLRARIRISADDALQSIELVSEAATLWSGSSHLLDSDQTIDLPPATASTHIYLRARQRDGALIYASPVFIDVE